jgi:predicted AAA+ superfamily ATPase
VHYYNRNLEATLLGDRSINKVRLIFGARQTGKSTLLSRILPKETSVVYNLQDSRLRRQFETNPGGFSKEIQSLDRKIVNVLIDEIQKAPALLEEVQFLYDADPLQHQFFITGSSARRLRVQSSNLLPGRCHMHHLYPVVRFEETDFSSVLEKRAAPANGFAPRSLHDRLVFGSLPGILQESKEKAEATLDAYVENYLEEEIRRESVVRDIGAFSLFLRLAAVESGRSTNLSRLAQESGIPASTLRIYYQVLVDTFTGYHVPAYGHPGRKRLLTTPRFLFFDLGVRNVAARILFSSEMSPAEGGPLLEHWTGLELIHRAGYLGRKYGVSFWRTKTGAEVDYIWQTPESDVPIEVKWTENPNPSDARHVETFLDLYPLRAKKGLVVCRVARAQQLTDRTTAIPWFAL